MNKLITLFFIGLSFNLFGQCNYRIEGRVIDKESGEPLPFTSLELQGSKSSGTIADDNGAFTFIDVCKGEYHVLVNHVACQTEKIYLKVEGDTSLIIPLHHHSDLLNEITVHGDHEEQNPLISSTINKDKIQKTTENSFSEVLESITGVTTLKSGSGISKPIIHGLYGNRVGIYNNGVQQAGQQWGNDHAPEIDAFSANHISVIKGTGTMAYQGSNIGGMVLIETAKIDNDPHLHAFFNSSYSTNGRGFVQNIKFEKSAKFINWRLTGTYKNRGDYKTPNYYLTNSGNREINSSLQVERDWNETWNSKFFFSTFNTEIGILRGTSIGNLSDLQLAIEADKPFYTKENFSRNIGAPKQEVHHQLFKVENRKTLSSNAVLQINYSFQLNNRKEFDVRRGGRSDIPALKLNMLSNFVETKYLKTYDNGKLLNLGIQYSFIDNTNSPNTGILPLIPDYLKHQTGAFGIFSQQKDNFLFEIGSRFDYQYLNAQTISREFPRSIIPFTKKYAVMAFSSGIRYKIQPNLKLNLDFGISNRPPEVNELFSNGLHQGVGGIEIGDANLKSEVATKLSSSIDYNYKNSFQMQVLVYQQFINNYIFLKPQLDYELTIRGAFPVFDYSQANSSIRGLDAYFGFEPMEWLKFSQKVSMVYGKNLTENIPLIYIPPNNFQTELSLSIKEPFKATLNYQLQYTGKQTHILSSQDFKAPPEAYFLSNIEIEFDFLLKKNQMGFQFKVQNLFDKVYRNYLNRQRYFADEMGRNCIFSLNYEI